MTSIRSPMTIRSAIKIRVGLAKNKSESRVGHATVRGVAKGQSRSSPARLHRSARSISPDAPHFPRGLTWCWAFRFFSQGDSDSAPLRARTPPRAALLASRNRSGRASHARQSHSRGYRSERRAAPPHSRVAFAPRGVCFFSFAFDFGIAEDAAQPRTRPRAPPSLTVSDPAPTAPIAEGLAAARHDRRDRVPRRGARPERTREPRASTPPPLAAVSWFPPLPP